MSKTGGGAEKQKEGPVLKNGSQEVTRGRLRSCLWIGLKFRVRIPVANPAIMGYNASSSLVHFDKENIFFCCEKRSRLLQRWR
jgi:hypothetical protein